MDNSLRNLPKIYNSSVACINDSNNCNGNGACIYYNNVYRCDCKNLYDPNYNCDRNFYETYNHVDIYYFVIGFILCLIGYFFIIPEVYMDFKRGIKSAAFYGKLYALGYVLFTSIDYILWCVYSISQEVLLQGLDIMFFNLAMVGAMSCYMCINLSWISLYTRLVKLSMSETAYFKKAKIGLIVAIVIFIPWELSFSVCFVVGIFPSLANIIYNATGMTYILFLMFWSWFHAYKMAIMTENSKEDKRKNIFLAKNRNLGIMNFFFGVYLITIGIYTGFNIRSKVWEYLILSSCLRVEEFIILCFAISILQNHYVVPCPCIGDDSYNEDCCVSIKVQNEKQNTQLNAQ